jgi:SP family arabinose:H+ symporter-like MFS transporter
VSFICGSCLDWRMTALTSAFMVLPVFLILPFIPESPMWLLSKNRLSEAEAAYKKIHGLAHGSNEFQRNKEQFCYDINQNSETGSTNKRTLMGNRSIISHFMESPSARRSAFVSIFLCIFQQLTGINGVNFYTVTIFKAAAGPNSVLDEHTCAVIVAFVFCFANLCSYVLIEKLGRKFLLILSTIMLSLAAFSLGVYFYMLETGVNMEKFIMMPLASLITFVLAFSIGYGPLLYVMVAEMSASEIRVIISPVAVGINWLCVFFVAKTFPGMITELGASGTFWLYGTFSLVSLLFTIVYVPETKGKSEDEIQVFFGREKMLTEQFNGQSDRGKMLGDECDNV